MASGVIVHLKIHADFFRKPYIRPSTGTVESLTGSAVRLNEDWALTAAHNLPSAYGLTSVSLSVSNGSNCITSPGVTISCSNDYIFPGFTGSSSNGTDLALIRLGSALSGPTLTLGSASVGELVYEVGFGSYGTPATGLIAADGNVRAFEAYFSGRSWSYAPLDYYYNALGFGYDGGESLALNGRGAPGDSGSGVFNSRGQLIGITTAYTGANNDPSGTTFYMDLTVPEVRTWIKSVTGTVFWKEMHLTASVQNNQVTVSVLDGTPNTVVTLQASTDLTTWADYTTVTLNSSGIGAFTEATNGPQRFLRAKLP